jgi:hypothetical protein
MKTLLLTLALALALAGCASTTPMQRVAVARQSFTATVNAITPLVTNGVITDRATLLDIRTQTRLAAAALDTAELNATAGNPAAYQSALDAANAALDALARHLRERQPATRPVSWHLEASWKLWPSLA